MSTSTFAILSKARRLIPPMSEKFHKGQLGRVAVIGGCQDYTGAPYFSAMASARLGCDMSHVICTPAAATVIKTYSPNLMVHPLMRQTSLSTSNETAKDDTDVDAIAKNVIDMLSRIHVLVVGPGLGRDKLMQDIASRVIKAARERNMPVVIDADALLIVQSDMDIIRGYEQAVLTPNVVEFERLCKAANISSLDSVKDTQKVEMLAKALGGVTIIQKGPKDYISNGSTTLVNDLEGGRKRSGGQGDTLTGTVATFLAWRKAYIDGLWRDDNKQPLAPGEMLGLAAFAGSAITRECSRLAFLKKGRSLQASDLTDEIHNAFMGLFGELDDEKGSSRL